MVCKNIKTQTTSYENNHHQNTNSYRPNLSKLLKTIINNIKPIYVTLSNLQKRFKTLN